MSENYIIDQTFSQDKTLTKGEYENCTFQNCDFSNFDFSDFKFIECLFEDCNLSLLKLNNTVFRDVKFCACKMLGLHFEQCNPFGLAFQFEHCQLKHTSFYQLKIKSTIFKNSQLEECDFTEADLSQSVFENCNLLNAIFEQTNMEKCDYRTAVNYVVDPENNRIKKAKFSAIGLYGLLHKYDIEIEN
jgi:fluoroquinolone resistance protein